MARIQLEHIRKTFSHGKVVALDDINLDIRDNEFFVLFGPAGAGKTTILNNIAGIQVPDSGAVKINGKTVNLIDPPHRNTAMVFENYALYPQMTVYDNIASPLRSRLYRTDEKTIEKKVLEVAEIMGMKDLLTRLPAQLSNGQKQRVALGRALVRTPNVYLMDEPLAHLDAKLRNAMRTELKSIQHNFNTTTVYVTHDFMEAMALGDRIAIINKGKIIQTGIGDEIYYMPADEFVSRLMGDPEINIIPGLLKKEGSRFFFTPEAIQTPFELPPDDSLFRKLTEAAEEKVDLGLRPQNLTYSFEPSDGVIHCIVAGYESIGNKSVITAQVGDLQLRMLAPNGLAVKIDSPIYVSLHLEYSMFFHSDSSRFIGRYNEEAVMKLVEAARRKAGTDVPAQTAPAGIRPGEAGGNPSAGTQ